MVGGEMMIDNEVDCNSFFDEMDDLVEFPSDNDSGLFSDDLSAIWSNPPLPYEDIAQLEWLSTFVEDSFSSVGLTITEKNENVILNKESSSEEFQTLSPISTGSSNNFPPSPTQRGFRTKRPRPATFTPPSFPDSSKNYHVVPHIVKNKKKKIKRTIFPAPVEANDGKISTEENVRKCTHCEITKTPQWRAGPLGPKTLCNACGVRHKSGRLFPEYRPAASPTFVASLHSNSHRKVLEMRNSDEKSPTIEALDIEK